MGEAVTAPPPDAELWTPAEVARVFRAGPSTVKRWSRQGKIRCIRTPGGTRRYLAEDVHALLNSARRSGRA